MIRLDQFHSQAAMFLKYYLSHDVSLVNILLSYPSLDRSLHDQLDVQSQDDQRQLLDILRSQHQYDEYELQDYQVKTMDLKGI